MKYDEDGGVRNDATTKKDKKDDANVYYIPPEKFASSRSQTSEDELKQSMAAHLVRKALEDFAWDGVGQRWMRFDGSIWREDESSHFVRALRRALDEVKPDGYSFGYLTGVAAFLKAELWINEWNTSRQWLPLSNGILDPQSLKLRDYHRDHRFTWQLPYRYDPSADCPVTKQWLRFVANGDDGFVRLLRGVMRAVITGRSDLQKYLEIIGAGGTGKSTFMALLSALVGKENTVSTDLKQLEDNRFESAVIYGKKLVLITDSSRYGGEVTKLKAITGQDPIRLEVKHKQQSGSFIFDGFIVMAANEDIQSTDYTSGLARRRLSIRFDRQITDEERESWQRRGGLLKAMTEELSGILNWVLGMSDEEVTAVISEYGAMTSANNVQAMLKSNTVARWMNESCVVGHGMRAYIGSKNPDKSGEYQYKDQDRKLYPNFVAWCEAHGHKTVSHIRFSSLVEDVARMNGLAVTKAKPNKIGHSLDGIRLRTYEDTLPTPITKEILS